jgi:hypothetical protein
VKKLIDKLASQLKTAAATISEGESAGGDGEEGQSDSPAATPVPAVAARKPAPKATRKSTTKKPAARKTTTKKRLPPKNNRLAPRALAARAEICNALRFLFSVRSPPPFRRLRDEPCSRSHCYPLCGGCAGRGRRWRESHRREFWPEIALSDVRKEMRITGAVTTSRLKQAVIEAVSHTADQLELAGRTAGAGFASLATVPAVEINDRA